MHSLLLFISFLSSNLQYNGEMRTTSNLKRQLEAWTLAGGNPSSAKYFGNVVHMSLISADDDAHVIDFLPPPELHLLIGGVNTTYSGWLNVFVLMKTLCCFFVCIYDYKVLERAYKSNLKHGVIRLELQ